MALNQGYISESPREAYISIPHYNLAGPGHAHSKKSKEYLEGNSYLRTTTLGNK